MTNGRPSRHESTALGCLDFSPCPRYSILSHGKRATSGEKNKGEGYWELGTKFSWDFSLFRCDFWTVTNSIP
uniref:Uncharacterized protein n=1 Tax=Anguilla anguilla TaxID=7936 RepID=A0A0E9R968_ANGAN